MKGARLFLPRWADVLLSLDQLPSQQRYFQRLLRECSSASSYIREVLKSLEDQGFLEVRRSSHINRFVFTPQGNELVFHLRGVDRLLKSSLGLRAEYVQRSPR